LNSWRISLKIEPTIRFIHVWFISEKLNDKDNQWKLFSPCQIQSRKYAWSKICTTDVALSNEQFTFQHSKKVSHGIYKGFDFVAKMVRYDTF
jgi:hypothetical protein